MTRFLPDHAHLLPTGARPLSIYEANAREDWLAVGNRLVRPTHLTVTHPRLESVHGTPITIDWHGVLDEPQQRTRSICDANVTAFARLYQEGYTPWTLVNLNVSAATAAPRRENLARARECLSLALALDPRTPAGPSRHGVCIEIAPEKVGPAGKLSQLQFHDCGIIVDDRQSVCRGHEDADVTVYRVRSKSCVYGLPPNRRCKTDRPHIRSFVHAIESILTERPRRCHLQDVGACIGWGGRSWEDRH